MPNNIFILWWKTVSQFQWKWKTVSLFNISVSYLIISFYTENVNWNQLVWITVSHQADRDSTLSWNHPIWKVCNISGNIWYHNTALRILIVSRFDHYGCWTNDESVSAMELSPQVTSYNRIIYTKMSFCNAYVIWMSNIAFV